MVYAEGGVKVQTRSRHPGTAAAVASCRHGVRWALARRGFRMAVQVVACACLLGCTRASASAPAADERASFLLGVEALERDSPAQAIQHFDEAIRRNDEDIYARIGLGMAHLQLRQYDEAFARYEQAIRLASPFVRMLIYIDRGNVKTELYQYSAESDFDAATRLGYELGYTLIPQTTK